MSPLAALRSRRSSSLDDLPPATSDDELLAWSDELVHQPPRPVLRKRGEPLRAPGRVRIEGTTVTTDELLDEIERRATQAARPRLVLRRA